MQIIKNNANPVNVDFEITKNTTRTYELAFTEDITDWTVYFIAKENFKDADTGAPIFKEVTSHTSPTNGETEIVLTASDTNITAGVYYYAISAKDDEGNEEVLFTGKLKILETVQKART